ncbi:hypothetical protein GQ53DRAFT_831136 [Thozetella sp. PMI_491]|nr:hypothetical protein GQ53DRAFT_831136 [Thozetella sp. PMI_491]
MGEKGRESDDQQGLLQDEELEDLISQRARDHTLNQRLRWQKLHVAVLYLVILCLGLLLAWSLTRVRVQDPFAEVYSPANQAIEYEDVTFFDNIRNFSPYQMPPSDYVDRIWEDLYTYGDNQRIDAESARRLPNATVVIPGTEGDGLVTLEVFHVLHCLNLLRKGLWPDRYPEEAVFRNGERDDFLTTHYLHCIDRLRQNVMCHSNTGTLYYYWNEEKEVPRWMVNMETPQKCRNFDRIHQWAKEHHYDTDDFENKVRWVPSRLTSSNP